MTKDIQEKPYIVNFNIEKFPAILEHFKDHKQVEGFSVTQDPSSLCFKALCPMYPTQNGKCGYDKPRRRIGFCEQRKARSRAYLCEQDLGSTYSLRRIYFGREFSFHIDLDNVFLILIVQFMSFQNNFPLVELLIENKADVNIKAENKRLNPPLHIVLSKMRELDLIELFEEVCIELIHVCSQH